MSSEIPNTLYDVVSATCTVEQIRGLLQSYKDRGFDVRTSGATKLEYVRHLRDAVDNKYISKSEVVDLVRDHEESGGQHIFYFRPKNKESREFLNNGFAISLKLFGSKSALTQFPNYETEPGKYVWADFRYKDGGGIWTAKIYGHLIRMQFTRQEEQKNSVVRYYDKVEKRVVCLAHWNGRELEYRIARAGAGGAIEKEESINTREIDKRLDTLLEHLKPLDLEKHVEAWDLRKACRRMLESVIDKRQADKKKALKKSSGNGDQEEDLDNLLPFSPCRVQFRDSAFGSAVFQTQQEEEELLNAEDRSKAIDVYMSETKNTIERFVINWNHHVAKGIWGERPLRTVFGGNKPNEIQIGSGINSLSVSYVTNHIRKFDK